ncbi:hypothetical protein FS749_008401 [Ceratobasidium sp. UAMH 11750]|nr:hypothetical protein FS749_008401 [Ceratobasidium sp. UAMH 11750]
MTGQRNRALAHVVEAQSHALLLRSATLEASTTPDQYKKRLVDEQPGLIPEPWGEPGRRPENLDKKTQKPKGYNLQKVLGLENHSALHAQNLSRISNLVTMYLQRATPYSQQDMTAIVQVITEYLDEQPIFCCYQDRWPIKSYIKSILSTRADANRKLNAKVARDKHAINQAANVALPSANAVHTPLASAPPVPAPAPTPALTPAPALTPTPANDPAPQPPVPTSHQAPADAPRPFGEAGNDGAHEPELANPNQDTSATTMENHESHPDEPPPPAFPCKKRRRGDLDGVEGVLYPNIDAPRATRARTIAANVEAAPGPTTKAKEKKKKGKN